MVKSAKVAFGTVASLIFGLLLASAPTYAATTYQVNRFYDPKPDGCRPSDCSLREAVIAANANPGSTVQLRAGTYKLTIHGGDNAYPAPTVGDLDIRAPMTIVGVDSASTIVQVGLKAGAGFDRVFDVYSGKRVTIADMTIRYGRDVDAKSGGCIKNTGNLALDGVVLSGCASPIRGGAISSYGNLVVHASVIANNSVNATSTAGDTGGGGGIAGGNKADGTPGRILIDHSRIANNSATNVAGSIAYGGGFSNVSVMTILDSTVSGNFADSSGGGISSASGRMTIARSTFKGNMATRDAGGLDNDGVMHVLASTFSDNRAGYQCTGADCKQAFAGGLLSTKTATTTVDNSTFSGNSCGANGNGMSGGGLLGNATLLIRSSTIVDNTCPLGAGVTSNPYGDTHIMDTILAGNHAAVEGSDCSGYLTSDGYNVFGGAHGCVLLGDRTGNVVTSDPGVGPLSDNGGGTETMGLLPNSVAVNAGRAAGCISTSGQPVIHDQRGFASPAGQGRCDIGAYERQS